MVKVSPIATHDDAERSEPPRGGALDVTACIPTAGRVSDLMLTLDVLLSGVIAPGATLVSHTDANGSVRAKVNWQIGDLATRMDASISLLPPPPCGNRSGNRNWLAFHVQTPFLLFVDDDVNVHPEFVKHAAQALRSDLADVVVAASPEMGGAGWVTRRGHFRPKRRNDPIAVGFACSMWRTSLFRNLWLDEAIRYGYEDADVSLRLHRARVARVCQSPYAFTDRGIGRTVGLDGNAKAEESESARLYVGIKRYGESRLAVAAFLGFEIGAGLMRRRRLPATTVPGQWSSVVWYLAGGRRPPWAHHGEPSLSHLRAWQ